jgi:methionine--tRNA ligase beta chain
MIKFEDFAKIDLRIGKILEASKVPGSQKLLKLLVDLGSERRQVIAGIAKSYLPESLEGKEVVIVFNLESKILMGFESQGMILAIQTKEGPVLVVPEKEVNPGAKIT